MSVVIDASGQSAERSGQFSKTKMCKFHIIGVCAKGSQCPFAHEKDELKPLPDLTCTKLCKTLISTGSCDNPSCTYAHTKGQLRSTNTFHKTKLCRFSQTGHCALGAKCNFAHSADEILAHQSQAPPGFEAAPPEIHVGLSDAYLEQLAAALQQFSHQPDGMSKTLGLLGQLQSLQAAQNGAIPVRPVLSETFVNSSAVSGGSQTDSHKAAAPGLDKPGKSRRRRQPRPTVDADAKGMPAADFFGRNDPAPAAAKRLDLLAGNPAYVKPISTSMNWDNGDEVFGSVGLPDVKETVVQQPRISGLGVTASIQAPRASQCVVDPRSRQRVSV